MSEPTGFARGWRRELRHARLARAGRALLLAIAPAGLLACGLTAGVLVLGGDPARVAGPAWAAVLGLGGLAACCALPLGRRQRLRTARRLDRHLGAQGAVLAAAHLEATAGLPRLAPLVFRAAGQHLARARHLPRGRGRTGGALVGILAAVATGLLLGLAPLGNGRAQDPGAAASRATVPARGAEAGPETPAATALGDLLRIEIGTGHVIYLQDEPIGLVISVRTLAEIGAPLPLDLRLGLSDGLPAPDRGMGPAFRVAPLDRGLVAPAQVGGVARVDLPLVPLLRAYGMHKPGLVTLVAEARPTGGNQPGGVRSNQITIQISEGREKQPIAKDAPAPTGSQPKESGDHRDEHQNPEARGDARPPSLGQPDLPEFATHAAAVKPLLRNGPLIEKEVEVFERERGGVAPLPPPLPVLPDHPDRTFLRRAEDALARPVWTPEDRRLLRRYFEALRRGG